MCTKSNMIIIKSVTRASPDCEYYALALISGGANQCSCNAYHIPPLNFTLEIDPTF